MKKVGICAGYNFTSCIVVIRSHCLRRVDQQGGRGGGHRDSRRGNRFVGGVV